MTCSMFITLQHVCICCFVEKLKTFLFQGVRSSRRPLSTSGQRYEGGRDYDIDNIVCHNCMMAIMIMIIILGVFHCPVAVFVCTMWVTFSWIYGKLERILCDCFDIVRKVGVCGPVTIGRVISKQ